MAVPQWQRQQRKPAAFNSVRGGGPAITMDGGPDEPFLLGEDTGSESWDDETCLIALLNSRLYTLNRKDEQYEIQLKSLKLQVKRVQKQKADAKEKAMFIEREVENRKRNMLEFGDPLPDEGVVWFCDECRSQLAAPLCPTLCPLCQTENSVNKTQIRTLNEARD